MHRRGHYIGAAEGLHRLRCGPHLMAVAVDAWWQGRLCEPMATLGVTACRQRHDPGSRSAAVDDPERIGSIQAYREATRRRSTDSKYPAVGLITPDPLKSKGPYGRRRPDLRREPARRGGHGGNPDLTTQPACASRRVGIAEKNENDQWSPFNQVGLLDSTVTTAPPAWGHGPWPSPA